MTSLNRRQLAIALWGGGLSCATRQPRGEHPQPAALRLGASTACLAGFSLGDALAELQRLGFRTIEIISYTGARHSVGEIPGFAYADASPAERQRVFDATRAFRDISAHLPFQDISLFSSSAAERESGLSRLRSALDGLAYLEGGIATMHIGPAGQGRRYRDIWQPMIDTLRSLGDYAGRRDILLGIETMQPDSVREYVDLIAETAHPFVGATVDTGHIRGSRDIGLPADRRDSDEARARFNDVLNQLVTELGDKVLHFHLSDVQRTDWTDHKRIGSGIIDFARLFTTVTRIRYRRLFVFELEDPTLSAALAQSKAFVEPLLTGRP
jgi:sugar phosphate isomerase/epimerase